VVPTEAENVMSGKRVLMLAVLASLWMCGFVMRGVKAQAGATPQAAASELGKKSHALSVGLLSFSAPACGV